MCDTAIYVQWFFLMQYLLAVNAILLFTNYSFNCFSAGHAMWPAIVVDESLVHRKGLSKALGGRSVPVQFFGTHDFARLLSFEGLSLSI